jgi:hypothetical protein
MRSLAHAALAAALCAASTAGASPRVTSVSGSLFVDYGWVSSDAARRTSVSSFTPEAALKLDAALGEEVAFTGKACVGCHGFDVAQAQLEWTPSRRLGVTAGRILVPFGDFSERADPAGHRTASKPLIYDMGRMAYRSHLNSGVLPMPYSDTGALVSGQVFPLEALQVWYGAYAVAGLQGDVRKEIAFSSTKRDDNALPAGGGRLAAAWVRDAGALLREASAGASFTAGRYGAEGQTGAYRVWGLDATARVADVTLRAEWAARRVALAPGAFASDVLDKYGMYAEREHPLGGRVTGVWRYDLLVRDGPLTGAVPADSPIGTFTRVQRFTAGLELRPAQTIFVQASLEHWRPDDLPVANGLHLGIGGTF